MSSLAIGVGVGLARPSAGAPAPWSPLSLAGLTHFFRADELVSSGGLVDSWTDQVSAVHATQTGAARPAVSTGAGLGGAAVVSCNGSSQYLAAAGVALDAKCTVVVVLGAITSAGMVLEHGSTSSDGAYLYAPGAHTWALTRAGTQHAASGVALPANSWIEVAYDNTTPTVRINGVLQSPSLVGSVVSGLAIDSLGIGARLSGGPTLFHGGEYAEISILSGQAGLTVDERAEYAAYVASRYGL